MNWTEGNLARHSRGRPDQEISLKQKQHFARVRSTTLDHAVRSSPPTISFFRSLSLDGPHHGNSDHSNLVKRRSVSGISPETIHVSHTRRHDLGWQRLRPTSHHLGSFAQGENKLTKKKQELLQKRDWVGTNVQKPISIKFATPHESLRNSKGLIVKDHNHLTKLNRHHLGSRNSFMISRGTYVSNDQMAPRRRRRPTEISTKSLVMHLGGSSSAVQSKRKRPPSERYSHGLHSTARLHERSGSNGKSPSAGLCSTSLTFKCQKRPE